MKEDFFSRIEKIVEKDPRYNPEAYEFVMKALSYTQRNLRRHGHVSGRELLHGIREYCFEQFGTMSKSVLYHWGIRKTEDFGQIVYNMVDYGLLRKSEEDNIDDFRDVYDFNDAFDEGFKRRLQQDLKKTLKEKE